MCVAQFRDYCNAFSFKQKRDIAKNHTIDNARGTFRGSGNTWHYVEDNKKMENLKKQGNVYALNHK